MEKIIGKLEGSRTNAAPEIEYYPAKSDCQNGIGIIIFPGGGYGHLAEHEGKGYAEHFSAKGIACFVVSYRLGNQGHKHPAMLEDALAAIATVRKKADEFDIKPDKIGIMGSSAGGHLTAHTLVDYKLYKDQVSLRPDFGILCYPVIRMDGDFAHLGSRNNLVGEDPDQALLAEISTDNKITSQTPPCFIWHTVEDQGVPVENSMIFASALRKNGVPFELHIYSKGKHGLGLNATFPWEEDCLRWLKEL